MHGVQPRTTLRLISIDQRLINMRILYYKLLQSSKESEETTRVMILNQRSHCPELEEVITIYKGRRLISPIPKRFHSIGDPRW